MQNFTRDRRPTGNRPMSGSREMFDAVCSECGNHCQIPFQPRQGKPVYCSNCFEKVEADRDREHGNDRSDRPRFDRPNFVRREKPAAPTVNLYEVNQKLDTLNEKLDQVLHMLTHQE